MSDTNMAASCCLALDSCLDSLQDRAANNGQQVAGHDDRPNVL